MGAGVDHKPNFQYWSIRVFGDTTIQTDHETVIHPTNNAFNRKWRRCERSAGQIFNSSATANLKTQKLI
jgi:hypothetical protein